MTVRVVLAGLVGAVALQLWGFVFWVVLSAPGNPLLPLAAEEELIPQLAAHSLQTGAYYFPFPPQGSAEGEESPKAQAFRERHLAGPTGLLLLRREGSDPLGGLTYLQGFLHYFLSSLLAGTLLLMGAARHIFLLRWFFVTVLGVFASVSIGLANPIWLHLPWHYALHGAAFNAAGWFFAGAAIAAVLPGRQPRRSYSDSDLPLWKRALDAD